MCNQGLRAQSAAVCGTTDSEGPERGLSMRPESPGSGCVCDLRVLEPRGRLCRQAGI